MSRIGNIPVPITDGAAVKVTGREISVSKGSDTLTMTHRVEVKVEVDDDAKQVVITRADDSRTAKAMHGLTRALIANMIQGVTRGFERTLEVTGVGWNAQVQGNKVNLNVGYADTRVVEVPQGVTVGVTQNVIKVSGASKQMVGQVAARIRGHRPPEPYNGKGIKYSDEQVIRKQGKAFSG